jgi:tRNA1Val (adenine37-N6)-methyltransferase
VPNNYFQFKEFRINQEESAMKVCTDSCLFGAWINEPGADTIIDIGTGTGLLALMVAQIHTAKIDAVEIDEKAFLQAKDNFSRSPWKTRLSIFNSDISYYSPLNGLVYDLIICNPPFFKMHLQSPDSRKNVVLHDNLLSLEKLVSCVKRLLSPGGKFYVMLPQWQSLQLDNLLYKVDIWPQEKLSIKEKADKGILRVFTKYSDKPAKTEDNQLIIRNDENIYTDDFKMLLKDFYLHL